MQYSEYYTSAAANPGQVVYFILRLKVSILLGFELQGKGDEQIELYYTIVSCWQRRMS